MEFLSNAFSELPAPFNMVVAVVAIVCLVSLIEEFLKQLRVFADHEADRRLKREMIDSGFGVEEAEQLADLEITRDYDPANKVVARKTQSASSF